MPRNKTYRLTITHEFREFDDPEARRNVINLLSGFGFRLDLTPVETLEDRGLIKLQEIFDSKPPRRIKWRKG